MTFTPRRWWDRPFDVEQLAWSSVVRARDAATALAAARGLDLTVDTTPELVAGSFSAIEHLRIDGRVPQPWGEFSGFFETHDGWVRLHGNYPHHAEMLRQVLGVQDRAALEREAGRRDAAEIEDEVTAAGGIAARVRTRQEWAAHLQARARQDVEWVSIVDRGERPALPTPAPGPGMAGPATEGARALLAGVRVLDLTRVIAGPSGTQLLACLGADVLRIDPPHRPELADQHLSTGMGKRSARLDLRRAPEQLRELAAGADVIVCGYRPGALPVQALDHATGQLLAAQVMESLARARATTLRLSLLGAAQALLALPSPPSEAPADLVVPRVRVSSGGMALDAVPPPLLIGGASFERPVGEYSNAALRWGPGRS